MESHFEPRSLGEYLKYRRLQLKLGRRAVARLLGVGPSTVLNWEKGYINPPVEAVPGLLARSIRAAAQQPGIEPRDGEIGSRVG